MRFTILLAFTMLTINSFSQNTNERDSLLKDIEIQKDDYTKIIKYCELFSIISEDDPDYVVKTAKEVIKEFKNIKHTKYIAYLNRSIGFAFSDKSNYDSSLFYLNKSLIAFENIKEYELKADLLVEMGNCSFKTTDYATGYKYLNEALKYYKKNNLQTEEALTYQNLGSLYYRVGKYEQALENYINSANIAKEIHNTDILSECYINIGSVLNLTEQQDSAITYYNLAAGIFKDQNNTINYGIALNNIGEAHQSKKDYTKAIKYYEQAYQIFSNSNQIEIQAQILFNIASSYYKIDAKEKSYNTFSDIIKIAKENNFLSIEQLTYQELAYNYKSDKKFKLAFEYLEKAEALIDTISQQEHVQELESLEKLYESKQKEKDIILLTKKNELNKSKIKAQFFANIAFMLIILVIIYTYRLVRRKNANYKKINQEYLKEIEQRKKAETDLLNMAYSLEDIVNQRTRELASSNNQLEREIEHQMLMSIELKKAKNSAEKANRLKTIFLANISHEIRTPLNAILGFSSLLNRPNLTSEKFLKYIHTINKTGKDLLRLINEIIDISKIEVDEFSIHPEPTNLKHLLIEQLDTFTEIQSNFEKPQISIDYIFDLRDNQNVLLDSTRIKQVLNNLVSNAFKFSNSGCITITSREISKNRFYFSVKDNGIGLSEDKVKYIFEAFRQGQEGHSKEYGGIGVGLSISSKIIKLMGSELQVDSKLGIGSNFYFTVELPEVDICKTENQMTSV